MLEFMKPTGYKPVAILSGLFFFQHFSGIFITMFYSISFIEVRISKIRTFLAVNLSLQLINEPLAFAQPFFTHKTLNVAVNAKLSHT